MAEITGAAGTGRAANTCCRSLRSTPPGSPAPLQSASSIAGLLLTTEAVVTEKPGPRSGAPAMPGGGGMGAMY
jgi:hypothetical protein